ncbi:hypothetical protein Hanom_Chr05g00420391 [Helianthus anomalus]
MLVMITYIYYGYGLYFFLYKHSVSFDKLANQNSNSLILSLSIYDFNKHTYISFSKFSSRVKQSLRVSSGDLSIFNRTPYLLFSSSNQPPVKLRSSSGHELPPHANTQPHSHPLVLFSLSFSSPAKHRRSRQVATAGELLRRPSRRHCASTNPLPHPCFFFRR